MDTTTEQLVTYALEFSDASVPERTKGVAVNHIVDAIGCIIDGYPTDTAQVAIEVARKVTADKPATVFGAGCKSAPAFAAFANGIMTRGHDWNDGMMAPGGGHPSDTLAAVLGAGEITDASGHDTLIAAILAYEVLGAIGKVANLAERGWDQGVAIGIATACGVAKLHGLNAKQLANAISLTVVPSVPLMVTRRGVLSMWKGAATPAAIRHAVFAVSLAKEGMTGPDEPFSGTEGVFQQLTGRPFTLSLPAYPDGKFVVELAHQKLYPGETHAEPFLDLVPKIRAWTTVDEIESIEIESYHVLYTAIGSDPSIWDPQFREVADHSLPFTLAAALVDGEITSNSFEPERFLDPALRPLMAKISITEDPALTANYRPPGLEISGNPQSRIRIRKYSGEEFAETLNYAKGHTLNPLDQADVNVKFDKICNGVIEPEHRDAIKQAWWNVDAADRIADPIATLARF